MLRALLLCLQLAIIVALMRDRENSFHDGTNNAGLWRLELPHPSSAPRGGASSVSTAMHRSPQARSAYLSRIFMARSPLVPAGAEKVRVNLAGWQ